MYAKRILIALVVAITALLPFGAKAVSLESWAAFAHFYTSFAYAYFIALAVMLGFARQVQDYAKFAPAALGISVVLFLSELWSVGVPQSVSALGFVAALQGVVAGCTLAYGVMQFLVDMGKVAEEPAFDAESETPLALDFEDEIERGDE